MLKKTTEIFFQISFFLFESTIPFRLIMENTFIQIVTSAGHAIAFTIDPIFKHIIHCVQLYYTNGFMNILL